MHEFSYYPWERHEKPYFVNEEGFEWYVDKFVTDHAHKDEYLWSGHTRKGIKDVVAFFVKKGNKFSSVLVNKKKEVIAEAETSIGLWNTVDRLKIYYDFATFDDVEKDVERDHYIKQVQDFIK